MNGKTLTGNVQAKHTEKTELLKTTGGDFPGGVVVWNPPANAEDMGSSPGPGRSHRPRSN